MTKEQLQSLVAEYLGTLDDEFADESYCTDRALARGELGSFITWLDSRSPVEPRGDVTINPALMGWKYFGPEGTEITAEKFASRVKHGDRIEVRVGPSGFDTAWSPENRGAKP